MICRNNQIQSRRVKCISQFHFAHFISKIEKFKIKSRSFDQNKLRTVTFGLDILINSLLGPKYLNAWSETHPEIKRIKICYTHRRCYVTKGVRNSSVSVGLQEILAQSQHLQLILSLSKIISILKQVKIEYFTKFTAVYFTKVYKSEKSIHF